LSLNVTAEHPAKSAADREPEAGATVFPRCRFIGLGERLKEPSKLIRLHPDACVRDGKSNELAAAFGFLWRQN
jgi:hypothetical protein